MEGTGGGQYIEEARERRGRGEREVARCRREDGARQASKEAEWGDRAVDVIMVMLYREGARAKGDD